MSNNYKKGKNYIKKELQIGVEYVLIEKNTGRIICNYNSLEKTLEEKKENPNSQILVIKTFKINEKWLTFQTNKQ